MIVINNNNKETPRYFDHNNIVYAFAEVVASNTHRRAILMLDEAGFIEANITGNIVENERSYELGELSIPFNSIIERSNALH